MNKLLYLTICYPESYLWMCSINWDDIPLSTRSDLISCYFIQYMYIMNSGFSVPVNVIENCVSKRLSINTLSSFGHCFNTTYHLR